MKQRVSHLPRNRTPWHEGGSRLLDYGGVGPTVLFVPSLVNRAYVLDLAPGHSMLRWLAGQGVRPLLLDWGWPGEVERRFTLTDYVAGRLERAMAAAGRASRRCWSATAWAAPLRSRRPQRRPDLLGGLALLAAPWDFHAADPEQAQTLARAAAAVRAGAGVQPDPADRPAAGAVRAARSLGRGGQVSRLRPAGPGQRAGEDCSSRWRTG